MQSNPVEILQQARTQATTERFPWYRKDMRSVAYKLLSHAIDHAFDVSEVNGTMTRREYSAT